MNAHYSQHEHTHAIDRECLGFSAVQVRRQQDCFRRFNSLWHESSLPTAKFMRRKTRMQRRDKIKSGNVWPADSRKHLGKQQNGDGRGKGRERRAREKKNIVYAGHWPQAKNQSSVVQNGLYPFIFYLRLYQSSVRMYALWWALYARVVYVHIDEFQA